MSETIPRREKKGGDGAPGWILTYGDMVTLLMAFFVMLFAMSEVKAEKFEAFLSGLAAFDNPAADTTPEVDPIGDPTAAPIPAIVPGGKPGVEGMGVATADLRAVGDRIVEAVTAAGHPGAVELQYEARGLAVVINTDDVLFESGSAEVSQRGREVLAALAPVLRDRPEEIHVEGHADSVPLHRGAYTNWNLSTDRAVAVVNVLAGAHGLPPGRLSATGYGEFDPRDVGDTPQARARNRRVEIVVLHPQGA